MSIETDDAKGQAVGSHIRMGGHVFGLRVFLDEVVTRSKGGSELRVFIDYDLPSGPIAWLLGRLCADWYAKWCVDQMLAARAEAFATNLVAA